MDGNNDTSTDSNLIYSDADSAVLSIVSVLSAACSLTFVVSYIVFYSELSRKPSYQILFYMFLSNVLTSLGSSVGFPTVSYHPVPELHICYRSHNRNDVVLQPKNLSFTFLSYYHHPLQILPMRRWLINLHSRFNTTLFVPIPFLQKAP